MRHLPRATPLRPLIWIQLALLGCGTDKGPSETESPSDTETSETEDTEDTEETFLEACYALCEVQSRGDACDAEAYLSWCEESCREPLVDWSSCEPEALTAWDCLEHQAWACDGEPDVGKLDLAQLVDETACEDETAVFIECLFPDEEPEPTTFHGRGLWCDTELEGLTWLGGGQGTATAVRLDLVNPATGHRETHMLTEDSYDSELDETTWTVAVPIVDDEDDWAQNTATAHDCTETWVEKWSAYASDGAVITCAVYADEEGIFADQGCDEWPF